MILRENPHNPALEPTPRGAWKGLYWLIPVWLLLLTYLFLATHFGEKIMDRLAGGDPDADLRARLAGLRVARGLLLPPAEGGRTLWQGRGPEGLTAGFFIAGAVRAERVGHADEARAFLALELLGRGDRDGAVKMLAGTGLELPATVKPQEPATWEALPIGKKIRESLERN